MSFCQTFIKPAKRLFLFLTICSCAILLLLLTTVLETKHQPQLRDSKANSTLALNSSFNRAHNQWGISSEIKPDEQPDYNASQNENIDHLKDNSILGERKRKLNESLKRNLLKKNESSHNSQTDTSKTKGKERNIHSNVKRTKSMVSISNIHPSEKETLESGPVRYKTKSSICTALMQGEDKTAIVDAERYMRTHKPEAITHQDYIRLSRNCTSFKNTRGYHSKTHEQGGSWIFPGVQYCCLQGR